MRTIAKNKEPASLTMYRQQPGATYEGFRDKDALRKALVDEQRGLCCYCLSRIRPEIGGMKIEHWHPQALYGNEQLDYANLLGSCMGNDGQRRADYHCDTSKADQVLSRNPSRASDRVGDLVHYLSDGRVKSNDLDFDDELNRVLNLNLEFLKANRKAELAGFLSGLRKEPVSQQKLKQWLDHWDGTLSTVELRPYSPVVVYWLKKKLKF